MYKNLLSVTAVISLLAGAFVASSSASAATPTPAFTPNHLFVGGYDDASDEAAVFEFDSAGTFVRKILTGISNDYVYDITFGPDGNLYAAVLSANRVLRITPTLDVTTLVDVSSGMTGSCTGVAFGPQGRLYVCCRTNAGPLIVFNPDGSNVRTYNPAAGLYPSFVTFGPDGHVFLSLHGPGGLAVVQELDANLNLIRTIGSGTFTNYPSRYVLARNGVAYVADYSGNQVQRYDFAGNALADLPVAGLDNPYGLATGPDGNLYVANYDATSNQVIVANPDTGATVRAISHLDLRYISGLAFAPFRFNVRFAGTVNANGALQAKLDEKSGVLSVSPGSGTVMIAVSNAGTTNSIFSAFPENYSLVFNGNDAAASTGKTFATQGASVSLEAATRTIGSITFSSKGSTNDEGFFVPKSASGTLQLSRPGNVLNANFTGSLIK